MPLFITRNRSKACSRNQQIAVTSNRVGFINQDRRLERQHRCSALMLKPASARESLLKQAITVVRFSVLWLTGAGL